MLCEGTPAGASREVAHAGPFAGNFGTTALFQHRDVQVRALRGTCVAFRHSGGYRLAGALALPHIARTIAGDVTEDAAERTQAGPAGPGGDLGHRQIGVAQQGHRPFDPAAEQVAVWRQPEGLLERAREVRRRYRTDLGQARD